MPTFSYIAKRTDGAETRGTINAVSADTAREELRKRGLLVEDVREANNPHGAPEQPKPLPWSGANNGSAPKLPDGPTYAPLHETLRIFAGWLLAWYGLIYALGFLESTKRLPQLPFIHELFLSPLVLQFTFGTFLLLALSNVHRWIGKGILAGFFLVLVYAAALTGFVVY